jgi:hypothetical protein
MLSELEATAENLRVSIDMMRFSQSQLLDRDRVSFFLHRFTRGDRNDPLFRRHVIDTFINSIYVFDDHLDIVTNNCEGNQRFPLSDLPDDPVPDSGPVCSDGSSSGVPTVTHPNTAVTIFRIAI